MHASANYIIYYFPFIFFTLCYCPTAWVWLVLNSLFRDT